MTASEWGTANATVTTGLINPSAWGTANATILGGDVIASFWGTANATVLDPGTIASVATRAWDHSQEQWIYVRFMRWDGDSWTPD